MSFKSEITARRMWFVPRFKVWGQEGLGDLHFLTYEQYPTASVLYSRTDIGDSAQQVRYDELIDHRGNQLPSVINSPRVMLRPRQSEAVFLVGDETSQSFKIVRDASGTSAVSVDLLVIEMGN